MEKRQFLSGQVALKSPGEHLTMPCFCFCFPFWGIGSSDLSAEDHYSNEKHFQELSPGQA